MKTTRYLLLLVAIAVLGLTLAIKHSEDTDTSLHAPKNGHFTRIGEDQKPLSKLSVSPPQDKEKHNNVRHLTEHLDRSMAKTFDSTTDEDRRMMLDNDMARRMPHYEKLFAAWALPQPLIDKVLVVVRTREEDLIHLRLETFKNGTASALENRAKMDQERQIFAVQLVTLLGQRRFDEMAKVDAIFNNPVPDSTD